MVFIYTFLMKACECSSLLEYRPILIHLWDGSEEEGVCVSIGKGHCLGTITDYDGIEVFGYSRDRLSRL